MIVKVQRSESGRRGDDSVVIYDKSYSYFESRQLTMDLKQRMNGAYKRFFHAVLEDGHYELGELADDQDW